MKALRSVVAICGLLVLPLSLSAQQADTTRYLFADGKVSGAGGVLLHWGSFPLSDMPCTVAGGGGGLLLDRRFFIGGFGQGLTNTFIHQDLEVDGRVHQGTFHMGYGGAWLAYSFMPKEPIHPYLSCQIGWGGAEWHFDADYVEDEGNVPDSLLVPDNMHDQIMVFVPTAGVELNMLRWFRPNIFIGYRMVNGMTLKGTEDTDLDGFIAGVNVMFGGFGDPRR